jgi:TonB family protein
MILGLSALCLGQDTTSGGPDSIIAGPFGEPRMVMSEGGEWSYPIKVFTNSEVETFVPDITSPGWVSWHISEFQQNGTYFTYLYIYTRRTQKTGRETVYVDTREDTAVVVRPLQAPMRFNISKAPLELSGSLARITAIVRKGTQEYRGTSVQESILKQKYVVGRMIACSNSDPDCNLSESDFEKKHPIYVTDPMRLFDGAKPGINCGVGTTKSCYYYAPENLKANRSANPAPPTTSLPDPIVTENGLYRAGGRVSAPIILSSVVPQFTDEARRAKHQGSCTVSLIVDAQGNPQDPHIVQGLGMGLDEKALDAVQRFKFKSAMLDGKTPVPVKMTISINFKLY